MTLDVEALVKEYTQAKTPQAGAPPPTEGALDVEALVKEYTQAKTPQAGAPPPTEGALDVDGLVKEWKKGAETRPAPAPQVPTSVKPAGTPSGPAPIVPPTFTAPSPSETWGQPLYVNPELQAAGKPVRPTREQMQPEGPAVPELAPWHPPAGLLGHALGATVEVGKGEAEAIANVGEGLARFFGFEKAANAVQRFKKVITDPGRMQGLPDLPTVASAMRGAGYLVPFALYPPAAVPGFASAGFARGYDEAKAKGADEDTCWKAGYANAAIDAATILAGGKVLQWLRAPAKSALANIAKNLTGEAATWASIGALARTGENETARELYDKNRDLFDGVLSSAGGGGIMGAVFTAIRLLGHMRGRLPVPPPRAEAPRMPQEPPVEALRPPETPPQAPNVAPAPPVEAPGRPPVVAEGVPKAIPQAPPPVAGVTAPAATEFRFDPNSTENEGRWRIKDPAEFDPDTYFRRKSSTPGVSYVMAKPKAGGNAEVQAVRFDKRSVSETDGAAWWEANKGRFERTWRWPPVEPVTQPAGAVAPEVVERRKANAPAWMHMDPERLDKWARGETSTGKVVAEAVGEDMVVEENADGSRTFTFPGVNRTLNLGQASHYDAVLAATQAETAALRSAWQRAESAEVPAPAPAAEVKQPWQPWEMTRAEWEAQPQYFERPTRRVTIDEAIARARQAVLAETDNPVYQAIEKIGLKDTLAAKKMGVKDFDEPIPGEPPPGYNPGRVNDKPTFNRKDYWTVIADAVRKGEPVPRETLERFRGRKWADAALAKMPAPEAPQRPPVVAAPEVGVEPPKAPAVEPAVAPAAPGAAVAPKAAPVEARPETQPPAGESGKILADEPGSIEVPPVVQDWVRGVPERLKRVGPGLRNTWHAVKEEGAAMRGRIMPTLSKAEPDTAGVLARHAYSPSAVPAIVKDFEAKVFPNHYVSAWERIRGLFSTEVREANKALEDYQMKVEAAVTEDNLRDLAKRKGDARTALAGLLENPNATWDNFKAVLKEVPLTHEGRQGLGDNPEGTALGVNRVRLRALIDKYLPVETFTNVGPEKFFPSEAAYRAVLDDPQVRESIKLRNQYLGTWMDKHFRITKGLDPDAPLESRGLETGARTNLVAILEGEPTLTGPGSPGDPNILKRIRSRFDRLAMGTNPAGYEIDPKIVWPEIVRDKYVRATRGQAILALAAKVGKLLPATEEGPEVLDGKRTRALTPVRVPGEAGEYKLWLPTEAPATAEHPGTGGVYGEARRAFNMDDPIAGSVLARNVTRIQTMLGMDATWHGSNILYGLAQSRYGRMLLGDVSKAPGLKILASAGDILHSAYRTIQDSPEVRAELAQIAQEAGLRGGGRFLTFLDQAGRLALKQTFDNLTARGLLKAGPDELRSFINESIGEYQPRLHGEAMRWLKAKGFSPFVVAGTTFNRMGFRAVTGKLAGHPASEAAALQLRVEQLLSGVVGGIALAALWNYEMTGNMRPDGMPVGELYLYKSPDGKIYSLNLMRLERRGLNNVGFGAVERDWRQGRLATIRTGTTAAWEAGTGLLHPWAGPMPQALVVGMTGTDLRGMTLAEAPEPGETQQEKRLTAALIRMNPVAGGIASGLLQSAPEERRVPAAGRGALKGFTGAFGLRERYEGLIPESQRTPAVNLLLDFQRRMILTPGEKAKQQLKREVREGLNRGVLDADAARVRLADLDLSRQAWKNIVTASKENPRLRLFRSLEYHQAEEVMNLADAEERSLWGHVWARKVHYYRHTRASPTRQAGEPEP